MSILSLIKHAPKRMSAVVVMIAVAIILPASLHAWGPSRTIYGIGGADKITFNSIIDKTDPIGDETNFVNVKDAADTSDGGWQDNITVQPGKEYLVRMYVHNNAATSLNLTATNTRVSASVPTTTGTNVSISGFVSADNADPQKVWDDIHFNSTQNFNLAYEAGSAQIWNNGYATTGQPLPDSIVTSAGALVGYYGPDGRVPGCFQFASYVYFKVKPQFAPVDKFETTKQVRKLGDTNWSKSVTVNPGDTLQYQITYKNAGEVNEYNVVVNDTLPAGITYVPGSSVLTNTSFPAPGKTVSDSVVTSTGINIGNYKPGSVATLVFNAKAPANNDSLVCGANTFTNKERTTADGGYLEDTANAVINKTCVTPAYVCTSLTTTLVSGTEYKFNGSASASNGASIVNYVINFGDGTSQTVTNPTNILHTYPTNSASYSPSLTVNVNVNGTIKQATSTGCTTAITIGTPPVTPPQLPHTGPTENIVAFLGLGALIASVVYYVRSRRALA
ncbi:DUF11 domain-containing protein [Patescibacteria group bacterium]|nr:MAG: DUF11 domain-containing protein [Patescibacteria group bacterium]